LEDGRLIGSGDFNGMSSARARQSLAARLSALGIGEQTVNYRLRDWLVSRQRYWGTPIPIVYCALDGEVAVPDDALPVLLPPNVPITGEGNPLANDPGFYEVRCPKCGGEARRETDTMDTFFDSSWYYVRYLDPHDAAAAWAPALANPWLNIDQYIGGADHAVLHLLYARFFYKYFHDKGWVSGPEEPFARLFNQGNVLMGGEKMSKSKHNVIGVDETVEKHGVDAMRLFLLKATPPEDTMEWTEEGIGGRVRFLDRVWRVSLPLLERARATSLAALPEIRGDAQRDIVRAVHAALKSGSDEATTRRFHFNTTLARLDELVNAMTKFAQGKDAGDDPALLYAAHALPIVLAPFAPHVAEELWTKLGHETSVHLERWPEYDPAALSAAQIDVVVQINGKLRARITVSPGTAEAEVVKLALAEPNVTAHLSEKTIRKQIFVPDKLLNIVAN
jgi:leucyl-tRNA synthetase